MKKLLFIALLFALASCAPTGSDETETTGTGTTATPETETPVYSNISAVPEKGRCLLDGEVRAQPIDDGNLDQLGTHFTGYTDESGYYIPGEMTEEYSEVFFDVNCDNELTGGRGQYLIDGIVKNSDPVKIINPLTKARSPVARSLFDAGFGTQTESLIEAERIILNYLNMPAIDKRFTQLSLINDSTADAASLMFNLVSLHEKTPAETGDFLRRFSTGVINNDLDLRTEIIALYNQMPIFTVIDNLKASYGDETKIPPIWKLGFHPLYFTDLIENEHTIQGSINAASFSGCSFESSAYQTFAVPHVLESWIETSKYIASNLGGDVSIWTRGFNAYDRPGTKILDVTSLEGIELEGSESLSHHGIIDGHSLTEGQEVYFVAKKDEGWTLTKGCAASLLPYGRVLASQDDGANWVGWNNNAPFHRRDISIRGYN